MHATPQIDFDWEAPEEDGSPEDLVFVDPEVAATPAQQRELDEFLREFQDADDVWKLPEYQDLGALETER